MRIARRVVRIHILTAYVVKIMYKSQNVHPVLFLDATGQNFQKWQSRAYRVGVGEICHPHTIWAVMHTRLARHA